MIVAATDIIVYYITQFSQSDYGAHATHKKNTLHQLLSLALHKYNYINMQAGANTLQQV